MTIVDESAGGFAVEFDGATDCRVGDCVMLRVEDEWLRVRVAFLDMQDVGVERFQGCELSSHTRLGLRRLLEDEDWKLVRGKHRSSLRRPSISTLTSRTLLAGAAAFVGGLIVFAAFGMRKLDRAFSLNPMKDDRSEARVAHIRDPLVLTPKVRLLKQSADNSLKSAADAVAPSGETQGWATGSGRATPEPVSPAVAEKPRPLQQTITRSSAASSVSKKAGGKVEREFEKLADEAAEVPELSAKLWSEATVNLAQPAFLLRADIVERLKLSHAQQAQLRRLLIEHRTSDSNPGEQLELSLGRRGMAVLTTQQKYLLESIRKTMPDSSQPAGG